MNAKFDIIVIGGGIAGISAAAELSENANTLVLEMEEQLGYHATGRSAAYFSPSYGNKVVRGITQASEHFFHTPPAGFCESDLLRPRSAVFIAREDQLSIFESMKSEQSELEEMGGAALRERIPILRKSYASKGLWDDRGGDIEVNTLLQAYLKMFRQRGGSLQTRQLVKSMHWSSGKWHVKTDSEEFSASIVVNAAGAWADDIAELAGLAGLGLKPLRRSVILIDSPGDFEIANWPLTIDIEEDFYFKPDAGQLLISPANETPSPACDSGPEELEIAIAVDRFESATSYKVRKINHSWAGLRTFAPDKTFVTGFDPRCEGFFWLAGQGGYGVQSAPGLAQFTNAMLTEVTLTDDFSPIMNYRETLSPSRLIQ